jgi:hypothetical protein
MSRKLAFLIFISSFQVILPVATSSLSISCDEPSYNPGVEFSHSSAYISVPFHYQINNYYCGPAALEMVFDYYGEDVPQAEIADVARTFPYITGRDEMRRAAHFSNLSMSLGDEMSGNITGYSARKIGYAVFEQWGLVIDDLKTLIENGEPMIVLMWWTPSKVYGHYRVVIGYNETHIIMHDPWNKDAWGGTYGGPNLAITYSTFLDLWEYSGNWALFVSPWIIQLQMPNTVHQGDSFEVIANVTYPCSTPFDTADYPAHSCQANIQLQEGLELASGETSERHLGNVVGRDFFQTSWSIYANETGYHNISVEVTGIVEGDVSAHGVYPSYSYEDTIGGSFISSLFICVHMRFHVGTWNNVSYIVDVVSNSTVADFYFNPTEGAFIRFKVTGEDGTAGFCRVLIPKDLLWVKDGWAVYVGGQQVNYTIIPDENYTNLYFTFPHSTKTVEIQGTHVITELPSFLIIPLFITTTLLVAILYRRKHSM